MKAEEIGNPTYPDSVAIANQIKQSKKNVLVPEKQPAKKSDVDVMAAIEKADKIAEKVSLKLHKMAGLLNQMQEEKDDIIRNQLARFFNVLKVFIDEALHPTGDRATDLILSGKTINVNAGNNDAPGDMEGELTNRGFKDMNIGDLPKTPKNSDIQAIAQSVSKAQASVKKLRNSLASAMVHYVHHPHGSSGITL